MRPVGESDSEGGERANAAQESTGKAKPKEASPDGSSEHNAGDASESKNELLVDEEQETPREREARKRRERHEAYTSRNRSHQAPPRLLAAAGNGPRLRAPFTLRGSWVIASASIVACVIVTYFALQKPEPPRHRARTSAEGTIPSELGGAVKYDASALDDLRDPVPKGGDLADLLSRYTSLEQCVRERREVDPLLADSLRSLGYDRFLLDSCMTLEGLRTRSLAPCKQIDVSSLQQNCSSSVAGILASPDDCPFDLEPIFGRSPFCLGLAMRSVTICYAARTYGERVACEATLSRKIDQCAKLLPQDRAFCEMRVTRLGQAIANEDATSKRTSPGYVNASRGSLTIKASAGTTFTDVTEEMTAELNRGVVVIAHRRAASEAYLEVALGTEFRNGGSVPIPYAGLRANLSAVFEVRNNDNANKANVASLGLAVPSRVRLYHPGIACQCSATVQVEEKRGGKVTIELSGSLGAAPEGFQFKANLETYVRDLVVKELSAEKASP
jgi:hypothetical protein